MNISSSSSSSSLSYLDYIKTNSSSSSSSLLGSSSKSLSSDDLSLLASMKTAVSNLSDTDKAAFTEFMEKVQDAINSGDFSVKELLNETPDSLKESLTENGGDLKAYLKLLNSIYGKSSNTTDSSEINDNVSDIVSLHSAVGKLDSDLKSEFRNLMQSIRSNLGKGKSASELADSASEELKEALEDAGIDLEGSISSMQSLYAQAKQKSYVDYSSLLSGKSSSSSSSNLFSGTSSIMNSLLNVTLE